MENTVIVFLSDNGMPFPRCKGSLYDSGIQTPLVFMWKGVIPENKVHSNGLVSTVDLAATLLDFAAVRMDEGVYSRSFRQLLFDPSLRGRIIYSQSEIGMIRMSISDVSVQRILNLFIMRIMIYHTVLRWI